MSDLTPGPILITGATGQVGSALLRLFPHAHAPGRAQLNLADPSSITSYIRALRPAWIFNPAAYTAVDKAETEPALAHAINGEAPRILGEEARRLGATVIHFSTDYVFDGAKPTPYLESDQTGPLGVYGASKLAGEQALAATGAHHLILRTSWVYAATGKNFLLTILRLARERAAAGQPLKIVVDQHGTPTAAHDLAALTAHLVGSTRPITSGTYHATASGETTWHGFASAILEQAQRHDPATHFAELQPIPTADFPTPARRPMNSRLDCSRLSAAYGYTMPHWRDALNAVLAELYAA